MRITKGLAMALALTLLFGGSAMAVNVGMDITIDDRDNWENDLDTPAAPSGNQWYDKNPFDPGRTFNENNEVEPGNATGAQWDLEGFFYERAVAVDGAGNPLAATVRMVGQYDFRFGANFNNQNYGSGDLFIDTTGDASYGWNAPGAGPFGLYGYEWALDFSWTTATATSVSFDLVQLVPGTVLEQVSENINKPESNPWRYTSGGVVRGTYTASLVEDVKIDDKLALVGNASDHNVLSINWAQLMNDANGFNWVADPPGFTLHFTMRCGNDNLMGNFSNTTAPPPVPEPASMALLGMGILCVAMRKRFTA